MLLTFTLLTLAAFLRYRSLADRALSSVSATFARQRRLVRFLIVAGLLTVLCLTLVGASGGGLDCGNLYLKGHTDLSEGKLLGIDGNGS